MADKKSLIFVLIFLFAFLFSMVGVMGTLVSPANDATLTGSAVLNATNSSLPYMVNCTFYAKSSLTANSSWTSLSTFTNASANSLNVNGTFSSSILEDANNYIFNATCRNLTNSQTSSVGTASITINNTIPVAPTSLDPADSTTITSSTTQTFSSTVNDARTTSCTYNIDRYGSPSDSASASGSGTYSTTSCSFSKAFTTSADNGDYYVKFTASDESDVISSSLVHFNVGIPGPSGGGDDVIIQPTTPIFKSPMFWVFFIIVIVVIIGAWITFSKN